MDHVAAMERASWPAWRRRIEDALNTWPSSHWTRDLHTEHVATRDLLHTEHVTTHRTRGNTWPSWHWPRGNTWPSSHWTRDLLDTEHMAKRGLDTEPVTFLPLNTSQLVTFLTLDPWQHVTFLASWHMTFLPVNSWPLCLETPWPPCNRWPSFHSTCALPAC